ncbi:MAG: ThiF family adenylyltransferase [Planctomycetes bacterium]|nr:ThiF family adenylyltransferase [Planctomycetota bacterium]
MYTLTLPTQLLDLLRAAIASGQPAETELAVRRAPDVTELLAPLSPRPPRPGHPRLTAGRFPEHLRRATHLYWNAYPIGDHAEPRVELGLFPRSDGCCAAVLHHGRAHALQRVRLVGPGMRTWIPAAIPTKPDDFDTPPATGQFSRYAGVLGDALPRLQRLAVGIVGVSRLGSPLALAFAKSGVRKLVLVDGDVVESHHLEAMELLGPEHTGRRKVDAVRELLSQACPVVEVICVPSTLQRPDAMRALGACDVIVTAPDLGQPRLLASITAAAYLRVHLDVGTGVLRTDEGLVYGADLRVVLPGACLLCTGGVDLETRSQVDWRRQRAGSLRSLNGIAASYAMFLFERLVAGELTQTTWVRLLLDGAGTLRVERPRFGARAGCPVCARTGMGDAAFTLAPPAAMTR